VGPFDRFNDRAKRVLALAQDEAIRFNHNYIGTEHLLLGLVREGEGVAARVLDSLGVELSKVRTAVEFIIGRGDSTTSPSEITLSRKSGIRSSRPSASSTPRRPRQRPPAASPPAPRRRHSTSSA